MTKQPMQVFQAFGKSLMSGTDSWEEVVHENVPFTGPVDQIMGIEEFSKLNESFMPMIKGNDIKQVLDSGNFVVTQVLMDVVMPPGKTIQLDMSEWYEIKDDKVQSIKIYYDAEEFRKEMV